ncbi:SDR family NAD(P)-dependent oxidoreductase [Sulfitobacter sp.]|jgi:NAD(P)-dependent dehydrogenase (short-subunit alcohol dehydrogenase family)|uniref:SDR family NAD(P)-dependent oxidoreductase n=1 Tax=Sulfitobacter sp. TaxID=1903071 RepID=UPI000C0FE091|nr:hypothetical protein [Roseobacter sp.]MBV50254.1 hypothetical protein [Roseobacter sp.]PHR10033.1 MAG: hypothetical protein COB29_01380 [Sulfitobacter sp.]|tara:strand:- start:8446 stop:9195 length:750 start_codon:yes stop_codon:yes gene_type:complete
MDHARQTCLIVGAASKIGRAIAKHYIVQGANVVITDPLLTRAQRTATDLLPGATSRLLPTRLDIADEENLCTVFETVMGNYGKISVFVLVTEIGTACDRQNIPFDAWKSRLARHLGTARVAMQTCLPYMDISGQGRVLMVQPPRVQGTTAIELTNNLAKHGLARTVHLMAREGRKYGVDVEMIAPTQTSLAFTQPPAISVSKKQMRRFVSGPDLNVIPRGRRMIDEREADRERFLRVFRFKSTNNPPLM